MYKEYETPRTHILYSLYCTLDKANRVPSPVLSLSLCGRHVFVIWKIKMQNSYTWTEFSLECQNFKYAEWHPVTFYATFTQYSLTRKYMYGVHSVSSIPKYFLPSGYTGGIWSGKFFTVFSRRYARDRGLRPWRADCNDPVRTRHLCAKPPTSDHWPRWCSWGTVIHIWLAQEWEFVKRSVTRRSVLYLVGTYFISVLL